MEKEKIIDLIMHQVECSQIVIGEFAEETGRSVDELRKVAACFAGGMLRGETCGAVIAAYNVIGMLYGHDGPDQDEQKGLMLTKMLTFNEKFAEKQGQEAFTCKGLLGADISTPEGMDKIVNGGLMVELCPVIINNVIDALKETISEE